ncbi:TetR family transcriptional regulator [Sphingomonas bacterium]|uniref:TetR family transcriptional regulator n=1 Tax=Sphingomonas bacterium TaxID=1895847 RepID=UPI0015756866|nr:TetR family transcriptional regulator [Sphingomonas bacterium]
MAVKRAYGGEDKHARREAILAAAAALFGDGRGDLPTAHAIAQASGLAKGTVYLYFSSKEAIFSALLVNGWGGVVGLVERAFAPSAQADKADPAAAFLAAYVAHLDGHRELLRLDALRPVLEHGLDLASLADFKRTFVDRLVAGGALIDQRLGLCEGSGVKLLTRTHALTCGLWQSLGVELLDDTAKVALAGAFHPDFIDELTEALAEYWRGALMAA